MECASVQKRLTAYIDNELDAQTRGIVKTHLNLCSTCSLEYDGLKKTLANARAWGAKPLPEGFAATVRERAERGEAPRAARAPSLSLLEWFASLPRRGGAWQVAAACALLLVGLVLGHLVWARHVVSERVVTVPRVAGERDETLAMLELLQKQKIVLGIGKGNERTIATLSDMQRDLATSLGPPLAGKVALYQEAEAMIAAGRYDDAETILGDLARDKDFVLAPYARITRLAAQPLPGGGPRVADVLLSEALGSPERLYRAVRARTSGLTRA
jgi:anti-sigma factor RsiW